MPRGASVDRFRLAYDHRPGTGRPVVLLHGRPGDRADRRAVVPLLPEHLEVVVPDPRGFGMSDTHRRAGHFTPIEAPEALARLIVDAAAA